jgi:hypothetical protein
MEDDVTMRKEKAKPKETVMKQSAEYITTTEVRRVCRDIGIRDWTRLKKAKATAKEAKIILDIVNTEKMPIDIKEFTAGLDVELEHGTRFKDANVTNNHPVVTGKIVLAHMKESLDYYKLLEVAELEGDLLKAVTAGNLTKITVVYKKLAEAKIVLHTAESKQIGHKKVK